MVIHFTNIDYGVERKVSCEFATQEEVDEIVGKLVIEGEKVNSYIAGDNKKII